MSRLVTVFGGTGTSGSEVSTALAAAGLRVRVATRDPSSRRARALAERGCEMMRVDLFDRAAVGAALKEADSLYLAGPSKADRWNGGEAAQGMNVADAAAEAGIGHFVYQSALVHDARGVLGNGSKRAIEERLAELDMPVTVLRPAIFMDNLVTHSPIRRDTDERLVMAMALPLDKVQGMVSAVDIGRAAAAVLKEPQALPRDFDLVGDLISFAGMARTVSKLLGEEVQPTMVPLERLEAVSPPVAAVYRWLGEREACEDRRDLEQLIGVPTSFRTWTETVLLPALATDESAGAA